MLLWDPISVAALIAASQSLRELLYDAPLGSLEHAAGAAETMGVNARETVSVEREGNSASLRRALVLYPQTCCT